MDAQTCLKKLVGNAKIAPKGYFISGNCFENCPVSAIKHRTK